MIFPNLCNIVKMARYEYGIHSLVNAQDHMPILIYFSIHFSTNVYSHV